MIRHGFYAIVLMGLVLFLAACEKIEPVLSTTPARKTEPVTLTLLHTNDFHSQFDPMEPPQEPSQGGAARIKTVIDSIRSEKEAAGAPVLLLNGGDNFQGTMFYNAWKGSAEVMFLNQLHFDAITLGNHEYDSGPLELARAFSGEPAVIAGRTYPTEAKKFLVLASNTDASKEPALDQHLVKHAIIEKNGQRFGLVGATTVDTKNSSAPGENVNFLDYVASVQKEVDALRAQGINRIILMSHCGSDEDIKHIAAMTGIDIIVAGHDHALFGDPEAIAAMGLPNQAKLVKQPYPAVFKNKDGENVLVVSAMEKARWLGHLDVTFDENGVIQDGAWQAHPLFIRGCDILRDDKSKITGEDCSKQIAVPDAEFQATIEAYRAPVEALGKQVVGFAESDFVGRNAGNSTFNSFGDLTADIALDFTRETFGTQAAIMNRGGMRSNLNKGEVRYQDINTILPFDNMVEVVKLSGAALLETLDLGVSEAGGKSYGAYPHVAGMKVEYCGQPCAAALLEGGYVTSVTVQGQPLDTKATYTIATNDYLTGGGDFYFPLKKVCDTTPENCIHTKAILRDVVAEWFKTHSPVKANPQKRVSMVE